jgi:hypothetical protein
MQFQKLLIFRNRSGKIARLLFLHGILHQFLGTGLRLGNCREE